MVRLFEKSAAGLLVEVDPALAEAARAGRRVNRVVNAEYDVLFTAEEEAARAAEEAGAQAEEDRRAATEAQALEAKAEKLQSIRAKLAPIGLTPEDLREVL